MSSSWGKIYIVFFRMLKREKVRGERKEESCVLPHKAIIKSMGA